MNAFEAKRTAIIARHATEIETAERFVRRQIRETASSGYTCINWMFDGCPQVEEVRRIVRERLVADGFRVDASNESVRWD